MQKNTLIFKLAVVLNFFKVDLNGEIINIQPVFSSTNVYLNNVSVYDSKAIMSSCSNTIQERMDDFIGKGSGKCEINLL